MLPTMTLEILQGAGCPGAALLAARLDGLLAGRRGVTRRVVASQAEAERLGMTGSPPPPPHRPAPLPPPRPPPPPARRGARPVPRSGPAPGLLLPPLP